MTTTTATASYALDMELMALKLFAAGEYTTARIGFGRAAEKYTAAADALVAAGISGEALEQCVGRAALMRRHHDTAGAGELLAAAA